MFLILLGVTFIIALADFYFVSQIFTPPFDSILKRIIAEEISTAWLKYLKFAIYIVRISSGLRIHELG